MLSLCSNEAARRSTWTCLSCAARSTQTLISGPNSCITAPIHQRKHSSSKTSSPSKDETRSLASTAKAPSEEAKPVASAHGTDKPQSTRSRRRKVKEDLLGAIPKDGESAHLNLPSVPSTKHIAPLGTSALPLWPRSWQLKSFQDIHVASFFSQHRPMSVSHVIPPATTAQAFSSLFDPPKPASKPKAADVIYTLSSAVNALEQASAQQQGQTPEEVDLRTAVTQASSSNSEGSMQHLDLPAKSLHINLQELAKRFRPFVPPPPPVPLGAMQEAARASAREFRERSAPNQTTWTSTLTVYESTHANGEKTFKTYATPVVRSVGNSLLPPPNTHEVELVQEEDPGEDPGRNARHMPASPRGQPFLGRMRERQIRYEDRLDEKTDRGTVQMISVKRQRKLKMKKHKYKKLMKRTKNLRRRLDRT